MVKNLPTVEGTQVLPGRIPHAVDQLSPCITTTEPMHPGARTPQHEKPLQSQVQSPCLLEPGLHSKRSHCNHRYRARASWSLGSTAREATAITATRPVQSPCALEPGLHNKRSHCNHSYRARAPWSPDSTASKATAMRSPCTTAREWPTQLEK